MAVVRGDPVPDGLQRRSDPVLPLLDEVEWDGSGLVGLEQLLLFAFELGSPGRKVGEFGGPFGHHLVEPGIEHRLPGAVASATMPARTHEMRVNRALTALRVADPRRSGRAPAAATASPRTDHPIHLGGLIEAPARVGQPSQGFRRLSSVGSRIEERGHGDLLVLCDGEVRSANP